LPTQSPRLGDDPGSGSAHPGQAQAPTRSPSTSAALFGSLADNGRPTNTVLLLAGNPGIGIVPETTVGLCPNPGDQRGVATPVGVACDAGAVQNDLSQTIGSLSPVPTDAAVGRGGCTRRAPRPVEPSGGDHGRPVGLDRLRAVFYGSAGRHPLDARVVGIKRSSDGHGYWLVAADGGVFAFGDAVFYGSMGGHYLNAPVVGHDLSLDLRV
jgi:hypothetical protein